MKLKMTQTQILDAVIEKAVQNQEPSGDLKRDLDAAQRRVQELENQIAEKVVAKYEPLAALLTETLQKEKARSCRHSSYNDGTEMVRIRYQSDRYHRIPKVLIDVDAVITDSLPRTTQLDAKLQRAQVEVTELTQKYNTLQHQRSTIPSKAESRRRVLKQLMQGDETVQEALNTLAQGIEVTI